MKTSGFKTQGSFLKKKTKMKQFREVRGENEDVLQVSQADNLFSKEIRKRDKCCLNCGSILFLGCSHYFSRGNYATRYSFQNCITLCQECHESWEYKKEGVYKYFMIEWLGEEGFKILEEKSKTKLTPYLAIMEFMEINLTLQDKEIEY